jgi:hypothetical protein
MKTTIKARNTKRNGVMVPKSVERKATPCVSAPAGHKTRQANMMLI